jgi:hypothetical protein
MTHLLKDTPIPEGRAMESSESAFSRFTPPSFQAQDLVLYTLQTLSERRPRICKSQNRHGQTVTRDSRYATSSVMSCC